MDILGYKDEWNMVDCTNIHRQLICSGETWHKVDILFLVDASNGCADRHTMIISGLKPI